MNYLDLLNYGGMLDYLNPLSPPNDDLIARSNAAAKRMMQLQQSPLSRTQANFGDDSGVLAYGTQRGENPTPTLNEYQALGMLPIPGLADAAGIYGDIKMYEEYPETRGLGNYTLSAAGALPLIPSAAAVLKGLPNPLAARKQNQLLRQQNWAALDKANAGAGVKRQKSTGRYIGAGPDVKSPQKKAAIVNKYAQRIEDATDAGVQPGYFYAEGRDALAALTGNQEKHRLFAELLGPTSTQVGPQQNLNYAIRAMDQNAMGTPVSVGMYPNDLRRSVQSGIFDEQPWTGYKVERYSNLLGPPDPHAHQLSRMPPNDQWEGLGTGWPKQQVPGSPTQVAFSDHIRSLATDKVNARRVAKGLDPLSLEEAQELHWLAIRAQTKGNPLQVGPTDTIQGSVPGQTFQHSWEAAPTAAAKIEPKDLEVYTNEIFNVFSDSQGKDRLVTAMGGELQQPMVRGTGVYKGETAPGIQSRSLVSYTLGNGLDPASLKRVDATEAVRQYALGQQGRAGHMLRTPGAMKDIDTVDFKIGQTPTRAQTVEIESILNKELGLDAKGNPNAAIVFTDNGYRVLNVGDLDNNTFAKKLDTIKNQLDAKTGASTQKMVHREGIYADNEVNPMDWAGGTATRDMLNVIDDPGFPGAARLADSPETRKVMGDVANLYEQLSQSGQLKQNQRLTDVLKVWSTQGLAGVRQMVKQGLAPAAVLGIVSQLYPSEQQAMGGA